MWAVGVALVLALSSRSVHADCVLPFSNDVPGAVNYVSGVDWLGVDGAAVPDIATPALVFP